MKQSRVFIYIEPARGYYARWVERTRERAFVGAGNVEPAWIEMLRVAPESWEPAVTEPEAA